MDSTPKPLRSLPPSSLSRFGSKHQRSGRSLARGSSVYPRRVDARPRRGQVGRKPIIIASTFIFGEFAFLTPLIESPNGLMLMRHLTGLGLGGAMPNIIALTSEYSPKARRATLVAVMSFGDGEVTGPVITNVLALLGRGACLT